MRSCKERLKLFCSRQAIKSRRTDRQRLMSASITSLLHAFVFSIIVAESAASLNSDRLKATGRINKARFLLLELTGQSSFSFCQKVARSFSWSRFWAANRSHNSRIRRNSTFTAMLVLQWWHLQQKMVCWSTHYRSGHSVWVSKFRWLHANPEFGLRSRGSEIEHQAQNLRRTVIVWKFGGEWVRRTAIF